MTKPPFQIDLWFASLADGRIDREWAAAQLSTAESSRANQFRFDRDRDHYIVSHALLRRVLADQLNLSPTAILFEKGPAGKPSLAADHGSPIEFNLSHSGDQAMIGVTTDGPIGVDIESVSRSVDQAEIVNRFFSPREKSEWNQLSLADRSDAFFRTWTRKEAYVKARGNGLGHDSERYTVDFQSKFPTPLISDDLDPDAAQNYWIIPVAAPNGYRAACAAKMDLDHQITCDLHELVYEG